MHGVNSLSMLALLLQGLIKLSFVAGKRFLCGLVLSDCLRLLGFHLIYARAKILNSVPSPRQSPFFSRTAAGSLSVIVLPNSYRNVIEQRKLEQVFDHGLRVSVLSAKQMFRKLPIKNVEIDKLRYEEFFDRLRRPKAIFHARRQSGCVIDSALVEIEVKANGNAAPIDKKSHSESAHAAFVATLAERSDLRSLPDATICGTR